MLEKRIRALIAEKPAYEKKLLLLSNDIPGVKVLRGKYRRHVLMKLLVSREADELIREMSDMARESFPETEIWFEVNPTTMM